MGQCKAEYCATDPRDKKRYTFYCVLDDRHKAAHEDHWGRLFQNGQALPTTKSSRPSGAKE